MRNEEIMYGLLMDIAKADDEWLADKPECP